MTSSTDPNEIRADIERTRAELSYNVDELADTASPKNIANRQVDKVKGAVSGVRDRIMGSPDDPYDTGAVGSVKEAVGDKVSAVGDRVSTVGDRASAAGGAIASAPSTAKSKARGNPLAAGLIAFGAGLLVSGLIPSSQKEQRAVSNLQEKTVEPLKQQVSQVAGEVASNLREPAQEAAESVKSTATEAVQHVKEEGAAGKEQVVSQAQDAKENVREARSS
jgi:gas vesicle protein